MAHLRREGLCAEQVAVIPGAAGGPKAIGLVGLDQAVFPWLEAAPRQREFIGASIGAWRLACALQTDAPARLARLAEHYTDTTYPSAKVSDITRQTRDMLDTLLSDDDLHRALNHPHHRLSLLVVASRGALNQDRRGPLLAGLALAAASNLLARSLLRYSFTRVVCHDANSSLCYLPDDDLPTRLTVLNDANVRDLLMATAAIPGVIEGIRSDTLPGTLLRDGGLADYHLDLPFAAAPGLALFPHFTDRIVPGWFDKFLPWRHADAARQANTIVIAPSRRYLASLPQGKLPDRGDFKRFAGQDAERQRLWRRAAAESQRLGDAFLALCDSGRIAQVARPLFDDQ
ncbi:hypothetical protein [Paludibacterium sp.]|uniref:hypothetical protein n=1 Tax=Paludibacterium sp. TaxID=1917523 RepID=UPI0025D6C1E9|nr:hypothetical protein [Paludibacterium sp.]